MTQFSKSALFTTFSVMITFVAGMITSIACARVLGPQELGKYSFATWFMIVMFLLVDPGMNSAVEKFVSELEGAQRRAVGNSVTVLLLCIQSSIGLVTGRLLYEFRTNVAAALGQPEMAQVLGIVAIGLPIGLTFGILRRRLAGLQRYDLISIVAIFATLATLLGTLLLLYLGFGVTELVILNIVVYLLQLVAFATLVWCQHNLFQFSPIPVSLGMRIVRYCLGVFALTTLEAVVLQRSAVYFLSRFSTISEIAYFNLAFNIVAALVSALPTALGSLLLPLLSRHFGSGSREQLQFVYAKATHLTACLALPICLGGIAISDHLIRLIYGESFVASTVPLQILFLAGLSTTIAVPSVALFLALGKPDLAFWWSIPLAIATCAVAYALVPTLGASGAALTYTLCQTIGSITYVVYLCRSQRFQFPSGLLIRVMIPAMASAGVANFMARVVPGWFGLILSIGSAAMLYVPALVVTGGLQAYDLSLVRGTVRYLPVRLGQVCERTIDLLERFGAHLTSYIRRELKS